MNKKIIGVDLGGTTTKFAIISQNGEILQQWSIETDILNDGRQIVPNIVESINHRIELYGMKPEDFSGIGMGSPGKVDRIEGTVMNAFNLNWKRVQNVKALIEGQTGLPFIIDNDANVAALGEKWQGAGEDSPDVVFVTLGTGVGGGVIVNNQLIHGHGGSAGEIGHINVMDNGYLCTCGQRGCLETVASATGIVHLAQDLNETFAGESELKQMTDSGAQITSEIVFNLAKDGDPFANMVVDRVCAYLGTALSEIANTLNPEFIVIGGGVSQAGQFLLDRVVKNYQQHVFPSIGTSTELRLASLGNSAGVLGAAFLVKQTLN